MPLLTVRLTDEEMAALKALAAETSMADLVRGWIMAGERPKDMTGVASSTHSFGVPRPAPKPVGKKR